MVNVVRKPGKFVYGITHLISNCYNKTVFFLVSFNWTDPLDLESGLTSEEILIRDSTRDFAQNFLLPKVLLSNRHESKCLGHLICLARIT